MMMMKCNDDDCDKDVSDPINWVYHKTKTVLDQFLLLVCLIDMIKTKDKNSMRLATF